MVTDWILAVCSILTVIITAIGVFYGIFRTLPNISKDINKSANERLDTWKRLIDLYANNPRMHEYSNLNGNADKK